MTITTSTQQPITQHDTTINQQHQISTQHKHDTHHDDPRHENQNTTQPRQEQQYRPGHHDPMACAASPDGPASKIHNSVGVDLLADLREVVTC